MQRSNARRHWGRSPGYLREPRHGVILLAVIASLAPVASPRRASAQRPSAPTALVFDGATVIDVEHGRHLPSQRVVVIGNRIKAMGAPGKIEVPSGARVIDARGKYLMPGLWDMHTHSMTRAPDFFYPLFIANGVTGIRDAGSDVSLDTLRAWRREILAGTRVGPPRQLLSGPSIAGPEPGCERSAVVGPQTCARDEADARHLVDSLRAAGADMIKPRGVTTAALYYAIADEARRQGIPFGGHLQWETGVTATEAADSGARLLDHTNASGGLDSLCIGSDFVSMTGRHANQATAARCAPVAARLRQTNTWHVPTLAIYVGYGMVHGRGAEAVSARFRNYAQTFWTDTAPVHNWLRDAAGARDGPADSGGVMHIAKQVGLPVLAGTDVSVDLMTTFVPGLALHTELASLVAEGLTPLEALQAATLWPAKFLRATDSLGTVASGKLADLILLDEDPLADITNTTTIRAVVANGRYYDRATLDGVVNDVRAKKKLL